jgi:endonuclease/exonuclease/phosphatase family metal-dependent hydrolase
MKKLLFILMLSACASAPRGDDRVRVLTYNIHAGTDEKSQPSIPAIAAFINSMNPDIVMLQEVDRRTARSKGEDHLQQLADLTHLHPAFGKSLDYQGGDYGIAVLSRWPIDSVTVIPLSVEPPQERSGGSHEPRVGLHARIHAPFGFLHVVNTHIDPAREGTFRKQEVIGLLARIKRAVPAGEPMIFGGDLNTRPNTDEISAISLGLTDAWANCGTGIEYTFPASKPDRRIDYVFYRQARCLQAVVPETYASDHRPLFVTLEIMRRP